MIDVSCSPSDAYPVPELRYEYDESYITIDGDNNVVALKEGSTTLKINAYQDGIFIKSASSSVTINKKSTPDVGESIAISFATRSSDDGAALNTETIKEAIKEGNEYISSYSSLSRLYKGKKGLRWALAME